MAKIYYVVNGEIIMTVSRNKSYAEQMVETYSNLDSGTYELKSVDDYYKSDNEGTVAWRCMAGADAKIITAFTAIQPDNKVLAEVLDNKALGRSKKAWQVNVRAKTKDEAEQKAQEVLDKYISEH